MYQGHHTDGSSVQAHSVGDVYPFIVFGKQCGDVVKYGVLSPNGDETPLTTCEEAHKKAAELKAAKVQADNDKAWAHQELARTEWSQRHGGSSGYDAHWRH